MQGFESDIKMLEEDILNRHKIIDFVKEKSKKDIGDYAGFEDWEGDDYYLKKNDYAGLVKYREAAAQVDPKDVYSQIRLGEAYLLNKEYEKSLVFLSKLHRKYPDFEDIQFFILDALFALGKSEKDFEWINKPCILEIEEAIDMCEHFLKKKRKGVMISDLYCELLGTKYLKFKEEELFDALNKDRRFEIEKDDMIKALSKVRIVRESKRRG